VSRRGEPVATRVDERERRLLERAAKAAGLPLGTWMRIVLLAAAGSRPLDEHVARAKKAGGA